MDTAKIKQIINITIPGVSPTQYTWTAKQINSTSYRIDFKLSVSLN
jgi:hypothetical protein